MSHIPCMGITRDKPADSNRGACAPRWCLTLLSWPWSAAGRAARWPGRSLRAMMSSDGANVITFLYQPPTSSTRPIFLPLCSRSPARPMSTILSSSALFGVKPSSVQISARSARPRPSTSPISLWRFCRSFSAVEEMRALLGHGLLVVQLVTHLDHFQTQRGTQRVGVEGRVGGARREDRRVDQLLARPQAGQRIQAVGQRLAEHHARPASRRSARSTTACRCARNPSGFRRPPSGCRTCPAPSSGP